MRGVEKATAPKNAHSSAVNSVGSKAIQKRAVPVFKKTAPEADEIPTQRKENKTGMPDNLKSGIENLSGLSMDHVQVHYNSSQPAQLNALAYAQGNDIHVAPGQEKHLPHEAWHVVQQMQGRVQPTMQAKGVPINNNTGLEMEADRMGMLASNCQGASVDATQTKPTTPPGGGIVQRVRGGIEYTEDGPTALTLYGPPNPPGLGQVAINRWKTCNIAGTLISVFAVPTDGSFGAQDNADEMLFRSNHVKLTNDVTSAEWVIERHDDDVPVPTMRTNLKNDIAEMFNLRNGLADDVDVFEAVASWVGKPVIALVPEDIASLHEATDIFVYRPGPNKGKAQITVQYTAEETIRRINLLNASKFRTGTKVAEGEDTARVAGTENQTLLEADLAGTTAFSSAQAMLAAMEGTSQPIPQTVPVELGALRLTSRQVGLIKLMVLNDAMATTMTRYNERLGQAEEKNVQRFFPKSRRDEYTRAVAAANLDAGEMAALLAEINRTAAADALLAFNGADPGALLVDQTFSELPDDNPDIGGMIDARRKLAGRPGVPAPNDLHNIKTYVLGVNGATIAAWITRAALAYTDTTPFQQGDGGNTGHYQGGGVDDPGNVMRSTEGFTPVAGAGPGAVYEFREREIAIDESGWFNIGSRNELEAAVAALFGAA